MGLKKGMMQYLLAPEVDPALLDVVVKCIDEKVSMGQIGSLIIELTFIVYVCDWARFCRLRQACVQCCSKL